MIFVLVLTIINFTRRHRCRGGLSGSDGVAYVIVIGAVAAAAAAVVVAAAAAADDDIQEFNQSKYLQTISISSWNYVSLSVRLLAMPA